MTFGTYSNIYLLIFLPLICSLVCCILPSKKIVRILAVSSCAAIGFLLAKIFPDILIYEKISNDFGLGLLSIGLEFRLDLLSLLFLLLIAFFEFLTIIFFGNCIKNLVAKDQQNKFYAVFLLKIFAVNGALLSNNLFDIYLFIEIYSFAYFGLASIAKNKKLLTTNFHDFCLSASSSLLILVSFFAIFLAFDEHNFEKIVDSFSLLPEDKTWFLSVIFLFLSFSIIAKFFPLWQTIKVIGKESNENLDQKNQLQTASKCSEAKSQIDIFLESFLMVDKLFIRTLLGIFLFMKFVFFFFGSDLLFEKHDFAAPLILAGFALVAFASYYLHGCKDLRLICAFLVVSNLGFICAALGIHSSESLEAAFFFLLNFSFIGMFIFLLSCLGIGHFEDFSLNLLYKMSNSHKLVSVMLRVMLLFIAAFPLSLQFFGYWYLAIASLTANLASIMIIALLLSHQSSMRLTAKILAGFGRSFDEEKKGSSAKSLQETNNLKSSKPTFSQIFALCPLLLGLLLLTALSSKLHGFAIRLASYLLANTL